MHKRALIALILGALAAPALGQAEDSPSFSPDRFRAHVAFLADDLLEGRNAGERGYDIAARYVASQMQALGLQPGAGGEWLQEVPLVEHRLGEGPASVTIGNLVLKDGEGAIVSANPLGTTGRIEAPAVFVGYGIDLPELGVNDYAGLDVRGKVVVMIGGLPSGLPSDVTAHVGSNRAAMAARRGAVGIVTLRPQAMAERYPFEQVAKAPRMAATTWASASGRPHVNNPGLAFSAMLAPSGEAALFAGARRSAGQVLRQATVEGAKPKGFPLKAVVAIEGRSSVRKLPGSANVLGVLRGSDPRLADEYVILMAHLDGLGADPKLEGDSIRNGALDNATGVASLIEAARAMAGSPDRPRRSILFAAVTGEEDGLVGAQFLARHPVVGAGKVVGVVNLDMPVLLYDFEDVIAFGAEHSTLGPIVERAAGRMGVRLSADPLPQEGLFTRSDHYRFVQEGIPSVFLMTGFANGGQKAFTHFLSTHYHRPSDDMKLPIDWQAGAKFARLNYLIAREIADSEQAPRWYADSTFGKIFAPDREKALRP